jgi:hypothetical protein
VVVGKAGVKHGGTLPRPTIRQRDAEAFHRIAEDELHDPKDYCGPGELRAEACALYLYFKKKRIASLGETPR